MLCIRIPVAFSFQVNTLGLETAAGNLSGIREGKGEGAVGACLVGMATCHWGTLKTALSALMRRSRQ